MPVTLDSSPPILDLTLYAGDVGDFQISYVDSTDAPLDVSAWVWKAQIRTSRISDTYTDLTIDTTSASTGNIIVRIPGAVTRSLAESAWNNTSQWDIQAVLPGKTDPITVLQGTVFCNMDVTR